MSGIIKRVVVALKGKRKRRRRTYRPAALFGAARRLLATKDQDQVSVAAITKEAGCSVGSFYYIFSSKDDFVRQLVGDAMDGAKLRAEQNLGALSLRKRSAAAQSRAIVEEMMRSLHGPYAGVIRAALKRGHLDRANLVALSAYRNQISGYAIQLLDDTHQCEHRVRAAVEIAQAAILDALLHEDGALRAGSVQMATTLSEMILGMINSPKGKSVKSVKKGETQPSTRDEAMLEMPVLDLVALPATMDVDRTTGQKASQEGTTTLERPVAAKSVAVGPSHSLPRAKKRVRYL